MACFTRYFYARAIFQTLRADKETSNKTDQDLELWPRLFVFSREMAQKKSVVVSIFSHHRIEPTSHVWSLKTHFKHDSDIHHSGVVVFQSYHTVLVPCNKCACIFICPEKTTLKNENGMDEQYDAYCKHIQQTRRLIRLKLDGNFCLFRSVIYFQVKGFFVKCQMTQLLLFCFLTFLPLAFTDQLAAINLHISRAGLYFFHQRC